MTGPNVVQLKQAGDSLMFAVTRCAPATTGKYPEMEIEGYDGDRPVMVQMPKSSFDRQLERLGLPNNAALVGKLVTVSRDPNRTDASKPYWGLTINGNAPPTERPANGTVKPTAAVQAQSNAMPEPSNRAAILGAVFNVQELCFTHALKLAAAAEKAGIPPTFDGVSALTAQALIEASRRGVA